MQDGHGGGENHQSFVVARSVICTSCLSWCRLALQGSCIALSAGDSGTASSAFCTAPSRLAAVLPVVSQWVVLHGSLLVPWCIRVTVSVAAA